MKLVIKGDFEKDICVGLIARSDYEGNYYDLPLYFVSYRKRAYFKHLNTGGWVDVSLFLRDKEDN